MCTDMHVCTQYLSSDCPDLDTGGGLNGQLWDQVRLQSLDSEYGGYGQVAGHYHVGRCGQERGESTYIYTSQVC